MRQESKKSGLICQGDMVALYGIGTAENIQSNRRPKAVGLNGAASIALFRRPREPNPHFMRDLFVLI